ncbi:MAG: type II toxin-antitoxin system HicA family toxin [Candidatus Nanoarchaeia archaeon]
MSKLPQITAKELIKILSKIGFKAIRQSGGHIFLKHKDGRTTVILNHPGEKIDRGLLNKIIKKDVRISREKFEELFSS